MDCTVCVIGQSIFDGWCVDSIGLSVMVVTRKSSRVVAEPRCLVAKGGSWLFEHD